jgi:hypothetical protein
MSGGLNLDVAYPGGKKDSCRGITAMDSGTRHSATVSYRKAAGSGMGKPSARITQNLTRLRGIEISLLSSYKCNATI